MHDKCMYSAHARACRPVYSCSSTFTCIGHAACIIGIFTYFRALIRFHLIFMSLSIVHAVEHFSLGLVAIELAFFSLFLCVGGQPASLLRVFL